nr:LptE family protein [Saprospiraceae bacterium]
MTFRRYHFIGMLLVIALCNACYSFRGVSISPDVQTFYVDYFELAAPNAPITLNQDFGEAMRDKIRTETRLSLTDTDPDLIFSGSITAYNITALDPVVGERTALNRLQISVRVNYESTVDEDNNWQQTFSFFAEFPADQNLTDIENQLIETIFEQLTEDIFNRAFSNW